MVVILYVYFIIVTDITFTSLQYQSLVKIVQYSISSLFVAYQSLLSIGIVKIKEKIYLYSLL